MDKLVYLPRQQSPDGLYGVNGGLYLIKSSYRNDPYVGRLGQYDRKTRTFTGTLSYEMGLNGFFVCTAKGEVFIPHYDVDVMGVFINAKVAK